MDVVFGCENKVLKFCRYILLLFYFRARWRVHWIESHVLYPFSDTFEESMGNDTIICASLLLAEGKNGWQGGDRREKRMRTETSSV